MGTTSCDPQALPNSGLQHATRCGDTVSGLRRCVSELVLHHLEDRQGVAVFHELASGGEPCEATATHDGPLLGHRFAGADKDARGAMAGKPRSSETAAGHMARRERHGTRLAHMAFHLARMETPSILGRKARLANMPRSLAWWAWLASRS